MQNDNNIGMAGGHRLGRNHPGDALRPLTPGGSCTAQDTDLVHQIREHGTICQPSDPAVVLVIMLGCTGRWQGTYSCAAVACTLSGIRKPLSDCVYRGHHPDTPGRTPSPDHLAGLPKRCKEGLAQRHMWRTRRRQVHVGIVAGCMVSKGVPGGLRRHDKNTMIGKHVVNCCHHVCPATQMKHRDVVLDHQLVVLHPQRLHTVGAGRGCIVGCNIVYSVCSWHSVCRPPLPSTRCKGNDSRPEQKQGNRGHTHTNL